MRRRGNLRRIAWPPGAARAEWPGELPIEDGDSFEVLTDGQPRATLTFRLLRSTGGSEASDVAQGMLLGSREQYGSVLRRLARTSLTPELWLNTERGRNPVYAPSERMGLTVVADADGWLYCVSNRSDGTAMAVFPAGAIGGSGLPAAVPASLPGHRHSIELQAGPPARSRCGAG